MLELQSKIENAGGERLKNQKAKVNKIQNVSITEYAMRVTHRVLNPFDLLAPADVLSVTRTLIKTAQRLIATKFK